MAGMEGAVAEPIAQNETAATGIIDQGSQRFSSKRNFVEARGRDGALFPSAGDPVECVEVGLLAGMCITPFLDSIKYL